MAAETVRVGFTANCSWGVASARHVSGLSVNYVPFTFDAPLGPSVVRWDLKRGERIMNFQAHSDLIVCMRYSPNNQFIATASTGGEIKVWSSSSWEMLAETVSPIDSLFHVRNYDWDMSHVHDVLIINGHT